MRSDYIPPKDADFLSWTANFSTRIGLSPTTYNLTAAIATTYATKQASYATALAAATNPATRGGSTIIAKDQIKKDLIAYTRLQVRVVQGVATLTDQQKYDLGITVRDREPTPKPVPVFAPGISIVRVNSRTVTIRLKDVENPDRRGKPVNVAGAAIYTFVGETPSDDINQWQFQGNSSRVEATFEFPISVPSFSKVWFSAFWFNNRFESGPNTPPVGTNLGAGLSQAA